MNTLKHTIALAGLVAALSASEASAVVVQRIPAADTFIDARYNSNFDSRLGMELGSGGSDPSDIQRVLMQFDLSGLGGLWAPSDGTLHVALRRNFSAATTVSVYEMSETNDDWVETKASWMWKSMSSPQVAWDGGSHDSGAILLTTVPSAPSAMNINIDKAIITRWLQEDPDQRISLLLISAAETAVPKINNYAEIWPKNQHWLLEDPLTPWLQFEAVPEPGALALCLIGFLLLPLWKWRREL